MKKDLEGGLPSTLFATRTTVDTPLYQDAIRRAHIDFVLIERLSKDLDKDILWHKIKNYEMCNHSTVFNDNNE
jgi:aspartate/glutamate racemase